MTTLHTSPTLEAIALACIQIDRNIQHPCTLHDNPPLASIPAMTAVQLPASALLRIAVTRRRSSSGTALATANHRLRAKRSSGAITRAEDTGFGRKPGRSGKAGASARSCFRTPHCLRAYRPSGAFIAATHGAGYLRRRGLDAETIARAR